MYYLFETIKIEGSYEVFPAVDLGLNLAYSCSYNVADFSEDKMFRVIRSTHLKSIWDNYRIGVL